MASVGNIDWPSRPGLSSHDQKSELKTLLDQAVALKLNAVFLQVRPACDALYDSKIEPWSEYLSGTMGLPPAPLYDPLAFAIEEAHRRGLEIHAWFNPFRARYHKAVGPPARTHISVARPDWIRSYGPLRWLDPAVSEVRQYSLNVILDVVRRYDIDGVHLDDYFYPYPEKNVQGQVLDFPDHEAWNRYQANGGSLQRADWRRSHVNAFVESLYARIKAEKRHVKFGISPFGIWRPGFPTKNIVGLDAYAHLYADARLWLAKGWCDYFVPQLYWAIEPPAQSYPALLNWWATQNEQRRHLWAGNNSAKVEQGWSASEIISQVRLTRRQIGSTGNVFWNMSSLTRPSLESALAQEVYSHQALIPATPWLDASPPSPPKVHSESQPENRVRVNWTPSGTEPVRWWVLQVKRGDRWTTEILPGSDRRRLLRGFPAPPAVLAAVSAVDRCGNASAPVLVTLPSHRAAASAAAAAAANYAPPK